MIDPRFEECSVFFNELANLLIEKYVILDSCNAGSTEYLIPQGTENDVTYNSKPINSFRLSDHWNWYTSEAKNEDLDYIQCYTKDLPGPNKRPSYWKASDPIQAYSVAYYGPDNKYHVCFGEKYVNGEMVFIRHTPEEVAAII